MNTAPHTMPIDPHALILREDRNGIARLTLNQPRSRNALSLGMLGAMQSILDAIAADSSIRVVVIAANGPAFCAGHDLKELTAARAQPDSGKAFFEQTFAQCARMMQSIVALPQPVIAVVETFATAAGCQLVATCDLAIAGENASFATPGVNIGLFCSTPMVALSRNVARKHAMEMLLTGQPADAETALRFGLVNRVVPEGEALTAALDLAALIASKARSTIKVGKKAFYEQAEMGLSDAYNHASHVMVTNMLAGDACEGIDAFIQKRNPEWNNS